MTTVYKYDFEIHDNIWLSMPQGAKVLHVDVQNNVPCMWALVDPTAPLKSRQFRVAGTGHPITIENPRHIGTLLLAKGALVLHVFEEDP